MPQATVCVTCEECVCVAVSCSKMVNVMLVVDMNRMRLITAVKMREEFFYIYQVKVSKFDFVQVRERRVAAAA